MFGWLQNLLLAELWSIVGTLSVGVIAIVLLLAAAYFTRMALFLWLALGVGLGTFGYGYGVAERGTLCTAQRQADEERAEKAASERDKDQGRISQDDAENRTGELDRLAREAKERLDQYEKDLRDRKVAACALAPADLPQRR